MVGASLGALELPRESSGVRGDEHLGHLIVRDRGPSPRHGDVPPAEQRRRAFERDPHVAILHGRRVAEQIVFGGVGFIVVVVVLLFEARQRDLPEADPRGE